MTAVHLGLFSLARLSFWIYFSEPLASLKFLWQTLLTGFRFDLRLSLIFIGPFLIGGGFRILNPFSNKYAKRGWTVYFCALFSIATLVFIVDFGHFSYLGTRLNASLLSLLTDWKISGLMVWQTYPVVPLALCFIGLVLAYGFLMHYLFSWVRRMSPPPLSGFRKAGLVFSTFFLAALGVHGKFSQYPLRWSDAFFCEDKFSSEAALNPVLHFFDTLKFRSRSFDREKVRHFYPRMAAYLGVDDPNPETLNFERRVSAKSPASFGPPNVIIIYMESFAAYKTGIFGNPLKPTPHFDRFAERGLFFDRFFTHHYGTARGVFAGVTGIPDVELTKTASRNPQAVNQHLIINAFTGYDKFYFLGGSLSWANIRGFLSHNIPDLKIFEEGSFASSREDVWGISDLRLFEEANKVFKQQKTPFFAIIQTSGNHRPYTIPKDNENFQWIDVSQNDAEKNGFISEKEYNAFRFLDHCLGFFFQLAEKEPYFENAIVAVFGDHGIVGNGGDHMPKSFTDLELTSYHVPLVLYHPRLAANPRRLSKPANLVDVLPTIAGLAQIPYINSTLGRDLLDPRFDRERYAFTILHEAGPQIGILDHQFYFRMSVDESQKGLHRLYGDGPAGNALPSYPQEAGRLEEMALGFYHTAAYMLTHNERKP